MVDCQRLIKDFPDGVESTPKVAPTFYLAKFRQKLHENEENVRQGGASPNFYYIDPSLIVSGLRGFYTAGHYSMRTWCETKVDAGEDADPYWEQQHVYFLIHKNLKLLKISPMRGGPLPLGSTTTDVVPFWKHIH